VKIGDLGADLSTMVTFETTRPISSATSVTELAFFTGNGNQAQVNVVVDLLSANSVVELVLPTGKVLQMLTLSRVRVLLLPEIN
jgi:hypothetical protein